MNSGPPPPKDQSSPRGFREQSGGFRQQSSRGPGGGDNRVYVGNLSWNVDDSALANLFNQQGSVLGARVIYDRESGRSRGFGFVTYGTSDEVEKAVSNLDGSVSFHSFNWLLTPVTLRYCSFSVVLNEFLFPVLQDLDGRQIDPDMCNNQPEQSGTQKVSTPSVKMAFLARLSLLTNLLPHS